MSRIVVYCIKMQNQFQQSIIVNLKCHKKTDLTGGGGGGGGLWGGGSLIT